MQQLTQAITEFISETLEESKKDALVIGLSGGVDSSVVASLCVEAAGAQKTFGVIMPCYSDEKDREWAWFLTGSLGLSPLNVCEISLNSVFDYLLETAYSSLEVPPKVAFGNLKARLRMMTLYHIAAIKNALVVGTGNQTEHMLGYCTKYGDNGTDFEPIGNLFKGEVFALAKYLDIPEGIISKPPSAGLWKGQTDEEELGHSYAELDRILKSILFGADLDWPEDEKLLIDISNLIEHNSHKTRLPQCCHVPRDMKGNIVC